MDEIKQKLFTRNKKKNIALIVASGILFLAVFDGWEYGFFTMLRFVVFAMTAYVAWLSYEGQKEKWVWIFGLISVLFNPFFPVYLDRDTWVVIDVVVGMFLLATTLFLKFETKLNQVL